MVDHHAGAERQQADAAVGLLRHHGAHLEVGPIEPEAVADGEAGGVEEGALDRGAAHARRLGSALFGAGIGQAADDRLWVATVDGEAVGALLLRNGVTTLPVSPFTVPLAAMVVGWHTPPCRVPGLGARFALRAGGCATLDWPLDAGTAPALVGFDLDWVPVFLAKGRPKFPGGPGVASSGKA